MSFIGRLLRRKPRRLSPLPTPAELSPDDKARLRKRSAAVAAIDAMPPEVKAAIRACDFPIEIQRLPAGFGWRKAKLVERIEAVKTHADAADLDRWLLQVGLRDKR